MAGFKVIAHDVQDAQVPRRPNPPSTSAIANATGAD